MKIPTTNIFHPFVPCVLLRRSTIVFVACIFLLILPTAIFAQQPSLQTSLDKKEILIGEQLHLKISATFSAGQYTVDWLSLPDSLEHFELISKNKTDSVYTAGTLTGLSQEFTITSFDSGKWALPVFGVKFHPVNNDSAVIAFTDSLPVIVSYAVADSTNELRDIKPIREADVKQPVWLWITGGIVLLLLLLLMYWFYRRWKKKKINKTSAAFISSYEEAITALEKLKQTDLTNPEEIKIYHSRLAEIFKQYLTGKFRKNYLNKTTGDVLLLLHQQEADSPLVAKVSAVLRCSDAVKFAKFLPEMEESESSLQSITESIRSIQQQTFHSKS